MQVVVIGIAGGSGSGKSTLVRAIRSLAPRPSAVLAFDSYYRDQSDRPMEDRCKTNFDHPNSLDVEQFVRDLDQLRAGRQLAVPVYDFSTHTRSDDIELVEPKPIVLVDGILLFVFEEVCELLDFKVFVDVGDEIRTERRVLRDVAERGRTRGSALSQIDRTVRPMYGEFVHPSMDEADLIVDGCAEPTASAKHVLAELPARLAAV